MKNSIYQWGYRLLAAYDWAGYGGINIRFLPYYPCMQLPIKVKP